MKTIKNIIVLIFFIALTFFITKKFFCKDKIITKTEQIRDTIYQDSIIYKELPTPNPDTIIQVDTIIKYNDSTDYFIKYAHLYQKYNHQKIYNDTLKNDSSAFISLYDIISENSLQYRKLTYINREPKIINKTTHKYIENKRKLFIGIESGMNLLEPSVMYKDLNDIIYKVGYDIYGKNNGLRFGIYLSPSLF
jgi:hypothetical protein